MDRTDDTTPITIARADAISPAQVCRLIPFVTNRMTVTRWIRFGFRGVRLKAVRFGTKWATTPAYVAEFIAAINAVRDEPPVAKPRKPRIRMTVALHNRRHYEADAKLRAAGM